MKRILCFVLAVLLVVSLAACGGKGNKAAQMSASNAAATALVAGVRNWSEKLDTDLDNTSLKMHAYAIESLKELKVSLPDGTETVVTPPAGQQVLCITADADEIRDKDCDMTHMGAKITVDNVIYYFKRLVVPKDENGAANLIFYACVPETVSPAQCDAFKVSVSLHPVGFEDGDDNGLNREFPLRTMEIELQDKKAKEAQ